MVSQCFNYATFHSFFSLCKIFFSSNYFLLSKKLRPINCAEISLVCLFQLSICCCCCFHEHSETNKIIFQSRLVCSPFFICYLFVFHNICKLYIVIIAIFKNYNIYHHNYDLLLSLLFYRYYYYYFNYCYFRLLQISTVRCRESLALQLELKEVTLALKKKKNTSAYVR